jgi:ABC-2 type transport system ATP-binding protein
VGAGPGRYSVDFLDVRAGYGQKDVLSGLTTRFEQGEIFVLLGPNGAGKSSLLRVLTGNLTIRSGTISATDRACTIGLVPQSVALYPFMTARENCVALAAMKGLRREHAKRRASEVLEAVGCTGISNVRSDRLSGGFQRRVDIAVALMNSPALLALDEPSAGLDAAGREALVRVLMELKRSGTGAIVVTHDFDLAESVADRIGLLSKGSLLLDAPPSEALVRTFGRGKLVELEFSVHPDDERRSSLRTAGTLQQTETMWSTPQCLGPEAIERLLGAVRKLNMTEREVRIRAPSLKDLYRLHFLSEVVADR